MRWSRILILCLFLGTFGYIAITFYTTFHPILAHPSKHGAFNDIMLLAFSPNSPLNGPYQYILLGSMVCMVIVINIEMRTRKSSTHGSARTATSRDMKAFVHPVVRFPRLLFVPLLTKGVLTLRPGSPPPSRLVLGTYHGKAISLTEKQQESNVLLTAPVGAGKSSRVIIPNLLRGQGNRSLFIADVKGELARLTAGAISEHHEVWIFSPINPAESAGYNPLHFIHDIEDAQELATCWVQNTGKSEDAFWPNAAIRLMTATILHLRAAEPGAPFYRLTDILCRLSYQEMKDTLMNSVSDEARSEVKAFFGYMDLNPKLVGSLMTDMGTRFQLLLSDHVRSSTAHNDIDFTTMAEHAVALYLSIPRRYAQRYQPLLACFVMQMFAAWERYAEASPRGQLPHGIMCYLDEFANLGYIPNISGIISTARASRVAMLLVLQSFNQLDEKYGQEIRRTIQANTVTHLLLPGAGQEETEYYSRRSGDATIPTATRHTKQVGWMTHDDSWTYGETGRPLFTADELRRMSEDQMYMLNAANPPLLIETIPYYRDRHLKKRSEVPYRTIRVQEEAQTPIRLLPAPKRGDSVGGGLSRNDGLSDADSEHFLND